MSQTASTITDEGGGEGEKREKRGDGEVQRRRMYLWSVLCKDADELLRVGLATFR